MKTKHDIAESLDGDRYTSTVPDTLDLAENAELAISNITGAINPDLDYEYIWSVHLAPYKIVHHACEWFSSNACAIEDLSLMRTITGSDTGMEIEEKMIESYLSRLGKGDLIYNAPYRDDAPWRTGGAGHGRAGAWKTDEPVHQIIANAHAAAGFMARYQRDSDENALSLAKRLIYGLVNIVIERDDYAYYPASSGDGTYGKGGIEFAYFRDSGWPNTDEAVDENDCSEGAVTCYIAIVIRCMIRYYALTADETVLNIARKLVKYILKPRFWAGHIEQWGDETSGGRKLVWAGHGGAVRKPAAHFKGHITGIAYTLEGLIEFAVIANVRFIKEFARQGYEYMRNLCLAPIGMWGENVINGYMAMIAIQLSDSGVGEYWEDVERYVRNAVVEDQFSDSEQLLGLCEAHGLVPTDEDGYTIERFIGGLLHHAEIDRRGTLDPTEVGSDVAGPYHEHFYAIWESIVRHANGVARVNLLLNRASPWLDIDSYLPYEGRVVIRNKSARTIAVRIPAWADRAAVSCDIDGKEISPDWLGQYLLIQDCSGGEVINIRFPMVMSTEEYYLTGFSGDSQWYKTKDDLPRYVFQFKGNTCIKTEFPNRPAEQQISATRRGYRVYLREHMRKNIAPMKTVKRYVAPRKVNQA